MEMTVTILVTRVVIANRSTVIIIRAIKIRVTAARTITVSATIIKNNNNITLTIIPNQ